MKTINFRQSFKEEELDFKIAYLIDSIALTVPSLRRYSENLKSIFPKISQLLQLTAPIESENKHYPIIKVDNAIPFQFFMADLKSQRLAFNHLLKENGIEEKDHIFHFTTSSIPPIMLSSKNIFVTVHDLISFDSKFNKTPGFGKFIHLYRYSLKKWMENATNIITQTNYIRDELKTLFPKFQGEIRTIYPYVSDSFYELEKKEQLREKLHLPTNKHLILSVSALSKRKNLEMVESVFKNIGEEFKLVRVGPKIGSSITFNGIDDRTLNELYNACDALYFPTLSEGFGYPIVEAFNAGLPVCSSDISVIKETSGNAAVLVDPYDLDENIEGIYKVIENSSYYAAKGKERAKFFSKDNMKKNLIKYYNKSKQ